MSRASATDRSFFYVAAKPAGGRLFGMRSARDERSLAEVLRRERLLLMRSYRLPTWVGSSTGEMSLKDRAELNDQLAQLLTRGVPLVETLEVVGETVTPKSRPTVNTIREAVAGGAAFGDACQRTKRFDDVTVAVYRAAERTGGLGDAAKQLSTTARRQLATSRKAATLMIYPAIVLTISVIVAAAMLMWLVPRIGDALREAGIKLPWFSQLVMDFGSYLRAHAMWVGIGAGLVVIAFILLRAQVVASARLLMRRLPLFRDVALAQETARFFSVMAALTRSGVPLADALGVATGALSHPRLRAELRTLQQKLVEGGLFRALIERVESLPLPTRRLLVAAERSGDLESAFESLAQDMADLVERRSEQLMAALEPALIVLMFLMIGSLLISIWLPMMSLTQNAF